MIRKYHNYKLQTNLWHREKEPHNYHETHKEDKQSKATGPLFPIEIIAQLEWTQSNAQQNILKLSDKWHINII